MKPLEQESEISQIRILVVDDEIGMRDLLSLELGTQGYQIVTAANGMEALDQIQKQNFDLVITDLKMPQMDGIVLLEKIKRIDPSLEVIMATGHGTVELAVSAMKSGAYDFVMKPFNLDELNTLIEKAIEKKGLKALVAIYESSRAIFSTIDLNQLLEMIMELSQKVLGADEGSIMLLGEDKKLRIAASRGLTNETARQVQLEIGERIAGRVAEDKRGRLLIDGLQKYEEFKGLSVKAGIHSSIVCPLLCQGELMGVLNLNRTQKENFTVADFQSASIFTSQAALALHNAKLYAELQNAYQELERAQGQLIQSEKLVAIGRLVAGVAHELNNPLTSVIGYSQLVQEMENLEEIRHQLPIISAEAMRCSRIVKDLLLFARRQKVHYQMVQPHVLIAEVLEQLALENEKRHIRIEGKFQKDSLSFPADPILLKQVFSNILINAYQSLAVIRGERTVEIDIKIKEEKINFSFKDNGPGIPKESLKRVFDPFFTTKEVGKGTGLGLSLSYGIIKDHAGAIFVESTVGQGTVFVVELPLKVQGEISTLPGRPQETRFKLPEGFRVLLAEDEESIRGLIRAIFADQGCLLDVTEDGEAALEMIKKSDYDLVLCDYRMPKLDGVQLFKETQKLKPALAARFLFITGSTEFIKEYDAYFKENSLGCLLKPFTRNEFVAAVNAVGFLKKA